MGGGTIDDGKENLSEVLLEAKQTQEHHRACFKSKVVASIKKCVSGGWVNACACLESLEDTF